MSREIWEVVVRGFMRDCQFFNKEGQEISPEEFISNTQQWRDAGLVDRIMETIISDFCANHPAARQWWYSIDAPTMRSIRDKWRELISEELAARDGGG